MIFMKNKNESKKNIKYIISAMIICNLSTVNISIIDSIILNNKTNKITDTIASGLTINIFISLIIIYIV